MDFKCDHVCGICDVGEGCAFDSAIQVLVCSLSTVTSSVQACTAEIDVLALLQMGLEDLKGSESTTSSPRIISSSRRLSLLT